MSGMCTIAAKVWRIHLGMMLAMTEFAGFGERGAVGLKHGHFLIMGGYQLVNEDFKKYEERHNPGYFGTSHDLKAFSEYQKRRRESRLGVLTVDRFQELTRDPNFGLPKITEEKILGRSKEDGLSKLLAELQVSWFIIQCIARGRQGLALTELELVTLAMASLNAITYGFWWNKPLGVAEPVNVYVEPEKVGIRREGEGEIDCIEELGEKVDRTGKENEDSKSEEELEIDRIAHAVIAPLVAPIRDVLDPRKHWMISKIYGALRLLFVWLPLFLLFNLTYYVLMLFPVGISILLFYIKTEKVEERQGSKTEKVDPKTVATRVIRRLRKWRYALTHPIRQLFVKMLPVYKKYPITSWFFLFPASFFLLILALLILSPFFAIAFIASLTFTAVFEIATTNEVPLDATHVPTFYSPRTRSDRYSRMVVFAIFGVVFGGIHCIGWNFAFPTHSERSLWRFASLVITITPLVVAPINSTLQNSEWKDRWWKILRLFLDIFTTALLFVYVLARLSLIVQAIVLLRHQPVDAYVAVDWSKYIPYFNQH